MGIRNPNSIKLVSAGGRAGELQKQQHLRAIQQTIGVGLPKTSPTVSHSVDSREKVRQLMDRAAAKLGPIIKSNNPNQNLDLITSLKRDMSRELDPIIQSGMKLRDIDKARAKTLFGTVSLCIYVSEVVEQQTGQMLLEDDVRQRLMNALFELVQKL